MKVKAIAPWYGSKRTLAKTIVQQLGHHTSYFEPFCGSMAVLLAKEPCSMETVNDLNGDLINLANVLKTEDLAVQLYSRLSRTLMHEALFRDYAAKWKKRGRHRAHEKPSVDLAEQFFVCSWMGMNGVAGTESYNQGFCARFTKNGGHAATRFVNAIESIPWWHHRIRFTTILSRCGIELCEKIEDAKATIQKNAGCSQLLPTSPACGAVSGLEHHHLRCDEVDGSWRPAKEKRNNYRT